MLTVVRIGEMLAEQAGGEGDQAVESHLRLMTARSKREKHFHGIRGRRGEVR